MKWTVARLSKTEFGAWIIVHTCPTKKRAEIFLKTYQHYHSDDVSIVCKIESLHKLGFTYKFPGEWLKIVLGFLLPSYYHVGKCLVDIRHFFGVPYIMERRDDFL